MDRILAPENRHLSVKEVPVRTINGLHVLLVSAIFCGMFKTAAGQSSAKAEVLAADSETTGWAATGRVRVWRVRECRAVHGWPLLSTSDEKE
jgi:hypothetical protein